MIVNKLTHSPTPNDVYIGRKGSWGNPYVIGQHGNRQAVVRRYTDHLKRLVRESLKGDRRLVRDLAELEGKTLVCFCKPKLCHGDVLVNASKWAVKYLNKHPHLSIDDLAKIKSAESMKDLADIALANGSLMPFSDAKFALEKRGYFDSEDGQAAMFAMGLGTSMIDAVIASKVLEGRNDWAK